MPELPDLEIYARNLRGQVLRRPILRAQVYSPGRVNVPEAALREACDGHQLLAIGRHGKELYFTLSSGTYFSVHLMLFGAFSLSPTTEAHKTSGKIVALAFQDGGSLLVADPRGMARVALNPPKPDAPDAMAGEFTPEYLLERVRRKPGANIKALLIDQHVVRGIGNAYVDEILYQAHVSPKSRAGAIPEPELRAIHDAVSYVFTDAIAQITRLSPDRISGEERGFLRVHQPKRKQTDRGEAILCEEVAKKRTYFTAEQRLYL